MLAFDARHHHEYNRARFELGWTIIDSRALHLKQAQRIDDSTPRYLSFMTHRVGKQARRVLGGMAECGVTATAREIGYACRLDVHTTSMVLGRLAKDDVVVVGGKSRAHLYSIKDPGLREWLRARRSPVRVRVWQRTSA